LSPFAPTSAATAPGAEAMTQEACASSAREKLAEVHDTNLGRYQVIDCKAPQP
jgi:hypothetical protein